MLAANVATLTSAPSDLQTSQRSSGLSGVTDSDQNAASPPSILVSEVEDVINGDVADGGASALLQL